MMLLGPPPSASLFPSATPAPQPAASRQAAPVKSFKIIAIDPGNEFSAWVIFDTDLRIPLLFAKEPNEIVLNMIRGKDGDDRAAGVDELVIERIACMGMAVGEEVLETVFWSGRFCQEWGTGFHRVKRHAVKTHLCGSMLAKDSNIRQRIIDLYGGVSKGVGGVKCGRCKGKGWSGAGRPTCPQCQGCGWQHKPGPLYQVSNDVWQALAVAITWTDRNRGAAR